MSRIAERHRICKSLEGLPPKSDPEGRVQYVWNRIKAEAEMVTTCQSMDPTKFVIAFPGNFSNTTNNNNSNDNTGSASTTSSTTASSSTTTTNTHNGLNESQQQQQQPSVKREKTSGRRASISVQRLLQYNILSADSLLHSVTRRISALCAAPLSTDVHQLHHHYSSSASQQQNNNSRFGSPYPSQNHLASNEALLNDAQLQQNEGNDCQNHDDCGPAVLMSLLGRGGTSAPPSAPHIELDQQELVEYFKFYNDWHWADEQQQPGDCFSAAGQKVDLQEEQQIEENSTTRVLKEGGKTKNDDRDNDGDNDGFLEKREDSTQRLLRHPEQRDELVLKTFTDQQSRFKKSLEFTLEQCIAEDLIANYDRDPAQMRVMEPLLYNKGFHALQLHRLAERLWYSGEIDYSLLLQSVSARFFGLDIHPAARMGHGVMIDHGTGVVIGETAVVGDNVSMLHNVTLGGTGKDVIDRHPKVSDGVLIGAGASVLGNVNIGLNARIAAGAVVVKPVSENCTVVGPAARELPAKDFAGISATNTPRTLPIKALSGVPTVTIMAPNDVEEGREQKQKSPRKNENDSPSTSLPPPAPKTVMMVNTSFGNNNQSDQQQQIKSNNIALNTTPSTSGSSPTVATISKPSGDNSNNNNDNSGSGPQKQQGGGGGGVVYYNVVDAPPRPSDISCQRSRSSSEVVGNNNNSNSQQQQHARTNSSPQNNQTINSGAGSKTHSKNPSFALLNGGSSSNNNSNRTTPIPKLQVFSSSVGGGSGQSGSGSKHHQRNDSNPLNAHEPITPNSPPTDRSSHAQQQQAAGGGNSSKPNPPGVSMTFDQFVYEI